MEISQLKGTVLALTVERNLRIDLMKAIEDKDLGLVNQLETELNSLDYLIEQAYNTFIKFHVSRNIDHWTETPS